MKLFPIFALLAAGGFTAIGYGAGLVVAGDNRATANHADSAQQLWRQTALSPHLVGVDRMIVPIRRQKSMTYVVAEFSVVVADAEHAALYLRPEIAQQLRAEIRTAMEDASRTPALLGVSIDSATLSNKIRSHLQGQFEGIENVLLPLLYKHDVAF